MITFKINELGCKVNQYESQLMREQLLSVGFIEARLPAYADDMQPGGLPADIYVINTCTVTASADSDSRGFIRQAMRKNPNAKIIVTGCYVEKDADKIIDICKDAIILKNEKKNDIMSVIASPLPLVASRKDGFFGISNFANHNRAFVKIQDGCNNFCSYCKVPLARGELVSRKIESVFLEANRLAKAGFKEIVLCGICLGAYDNLIGLLDELENIDGLKRIRLSSIEPAYVTEELIDVISSSEKICRHLHIPLQSGDNDILKAMNRRYTKEQYVGLIDKIRAKMPDIAIATDVLVGFPGETEQNFNNTLNTLKAVRPMRAHVFGFSKREATKAFSMPGEVEKKEKSRRIGIVKILSGEFAFSYAKKFEGKTVRVLAESSRDKKTGLLTGYADNYIKVFFEGSDSLVNKIIDVKIVKVMPGNVIGKINGN